VPDGSLILRGSTRSGTCIGVIFQIDHLTQAIAGCWWDIGRSEDQEFDCAYLDPVSMVALIGTIEMLAKAAGDPWYEWWQGLADRVSPLTWWEVAEVDDESYAYELLYHLETCHPRSVLAEGPGWFDHHQVRLGQDRP